MRKRFLLHKFLVLSIVVTSSLCLTGCGLSGCGKKKDKTETDTMVEVTVSGGSAELDISDGNHDLAVSGSDLGTQENGADVSDGSGVTDSVTLADKTDTEDSSLLGKLFGDKKNDKDSDKTNTGSKDNTTATAKPDSGNANSGNNGGNGTGTSGNSGTGSDSTPTAAPTATQKPSATTAPAATEKPSATAKPVATTAPTTAPVATAKPTQTPGIAAHTCVWNSGSVTKAATCKEEGTMTYTCTVCNAIRTESVAKKDHTYVTQSTAASCTESGYAYYVCSSCGESGGKTAEGTALGHDFQKVWGWLDAGGPTCTSGADWYMKCSRCGEVGESGRDAALPHTMVGTVTFEGNCSDPTIVEYRCSVCGAPGGYDYYYPDVHDWVQVLSDPYWSDEAQDFVQDELTCCSRCHIEQ